MTNGDMRYGRCGVCGGGEVYQGELVGNGLRAKGSLGGKRAIFDVLICMHCGHTQTHTRLTEDMARHIRRKLDRVRPEDSTG